MVDSPLFIECPFDDPIIHETTDPGDLVFESVGDYDAFGAFSDRDSYPGPQ